MAVITKTIANGNPGGTYDYSDPNAWEAANGGSASANLVANGDSIVGQCFTAGGEFVLGTAVTISGFTTDASHTITLTTGTGQSFRDNANAQTNKLTYNASNGAAIRVTQHYVQGFQVSSNYVTFSKLQLKDDHTGGCYINSSSAGGVLDDCIAVSSFGAIPVSFNGNNGVVQNTLAIVLAGGGPGIRFSGAHTALGCTVVTPSDVTRSTNAGFESHAGTSKVAGCCAFNFTGFIQAGGSWTSDSDYNATDSSSTTLPVTTHSLGSLTYGNQFRGTATASMDFALKSGADLIDSSTNLGLTTDIVGTARPQSTAYDIGAWEFVFAGASFIAQRPLIINQAPNRASTY